MRDQGPALTEGVVWWGQVHVTWHRWVGEGTERERGGHLGFSHRAAEEAPPLGRLQTDLNEERDGATRWGAVPGQ